MNGGDTAYSHGIPNRVTLLPATLRVIIEVLIIDRGRRFAIIHVDFER